MLNMLFSTNIVLAITSVIFLLVIIEEIARHFYKDYCIARNPSKKLYFLKKDLESLSTRYNMDPAIILKVISKD